jgi:glycosyltransferase 2 family protein
LPLPLLTVIISKNKLFRESVLSVSASHKKHIGILLRLMVAVVILYFVFRGQDWTKLRNTFLAMSLWVFLASVGIFVVCQLIVSFRWWMLMRTQGVHLGLWPAIQLNFLGLFYNNFLPSSVGGDLVRAWYVTKHTHKRFEAALSVLVDRVIGLVSIAILAFLAWWLLFDFKSLDMGNVRAMGFVRRHEREAVWMLIACVVFAVIIAIVPATRRRVLAIWAKLKEYASHLYHRGYDAAKLYFKNPWTLMGTVFVTFFSQSIVVVAFWLVGRDMGIEADFKYYMVFFPLSWVLGALPISVAGAGVVEGWLVILFTSNVMGVSREAATALALVQRAVWMLVSLPGLVIYLTGGHLPKDFFIDYQKSVN